jgi:hypothetical protein
MHANDYKRLDDRDFDRKSWMALWDRLPDFARKNAIKFVLQQLHALESSGRWRISWDYETNQQREDASQGAHSDDAITFEFHSDQPDDVITFKGSLQIGNKPTTPVLPKSSAKPFIRRPVHAETKPVAQDSGLSLIQKLQARNADRKHATDGGIHAQKRTPPISRKALRAVETAIGFELPELLREIYLKVGNGGFGPQYGIIGTKGGVKIQKLTLETCYQEMTKLEERNPRWRWPKHLLPLADYGCGMWSCVDCEYKSLPMLLWDPNNLSSALKGADARLNWGNAFWDQGRSLETWLDGWLQGTKEPEPKWPSDSWMKRRLGFTLPK